MATQDVSAIITEIRAMGISKYQLARMLKVTWLTVHNWERGIFKPSAQNLKQLFNILEKNTN